MTFDTAFPLKEASKEDEMHIITHRRRLRDDPEEYARKLSEQRECNPIPEDVLVLFLEIDVEDPSEFEEVLEVRGKAMHAASKAFCAEFEQGQQWPD